MTVVVTVGTPSAPSCTPRMVLRAGRSKSASTASAAAVPDAPMTGASDATM